MKVAIIGAGLSGLACAHALETKYNIKPDIFERNSYIGDSYNHVTAILEVFHRPYGNCIDYFNNKLNLQIKPLNELKKVIHISPNNSKTISGNLGYLFLRGRFENSLKNQVYKQLKKSKISFNTFADYTTLKDKYDYVIIADGSINSTKQLCYYQEWLSPVVIGVNAYGKFKKDTLIVWLNKKYCNNGYVYLAPFDEKKAFIGLVITDIKKHEAPEYLNLFLAMENINCTIEKEFTVTHKTGYVYPHKINNIYLVGTASGGIDPFLGFGQLNAFITGAKAAKSIALEKNYENLLKKQIDHIMNLYEYRKLYDSATNDSYDKLLNFISIPGIKQFIYDSNIDVVKYSGNLLHYKRILSKKINGKI